MNRAVTFKPPPRLESPSADIVLSEQQEAVIDWMKNGTGSAFVEAVAGSGKSFTCLKVCEVIPGSMSSAFMAFNTSIAKSNEQKLRAMGIDHVMSRTCHSFGNSAWSYRTNRRHSVDNNKMYTAMDDLGTPNSLRGALRKLVSLAKQSVVGREWRIEDDKSWREIIDHHDILLDIDREYTKDIESLVEDLIGHAVSMLNWSRKYGPTIIDFDDMIWLPLVEHCNFFQNDRVLMDEAQDTNPARRLMVQEMVKPPERGGRTLWVGDRYQSIYGFTGADDDAVERIIKDFDCKLFPLTTTYRCSFAVSKKAREFVPEIWSHDSCKEGKLDHVSRGAFRGTDGTVSNISTPTMLDLRKGDAVLCRVNRPLVSLAYELLRCGIGCHIEGRNIGEGLIKLATYWKSDDIGELASHLEKYRQRETRKYLDKGREDKIAALNDKVDSLLIIMEKCNTVSEVVLQIERMFKKTDDGITPDTVVLSSIHKAKGREWNRVFILGWDYYMPSPWAKKKWQKQQEKNLIYVAVTRSLDELYLLPSLEDY